MKKTFLAGFAAALLIAAAPLAMVTDAQAANLWGNAQVGAGGSIGNSGVQTGANNWANTANSGTALGAAGTQSFGNATASHQGGYVFGATGPTGGNGQVATEAGSQSGAFSGSFGNGSATAATGGSGSGSGFSWGASGAGNLGGGF